MDLFDTDGLDELAEAINNTKKAYKKGVKKFMRAEGAKLRKRTAKTAKSYIGEKSGKYHKSIKRGKYYKYKGNNADSIRVYSGVPHGHLIEYGHEMIGHKPAKNHLGYVNGHLVFKAAADSFENEYEGDCEKFNAEVMKMLE